MKRFTVTDDHLKLARRMYMGWCGDEFGAPSVDPKRPYGNSDVFSDMAEILGIEPEPEDGFSVSQMDRMGSLHEEMRVVLQIALRTTRFEVGEYYANDYTEDWRPVPRRA